MHRPWSDEEIEFLKNNYQRMSIFEMAKQLGRSYYAVSHMLRRLGLKKNDRGGKLWTEEEDEMLRKLVSAGLPQKTIAFILNRTIPSIQSRMKYLGLKIKEFQLTNTMSNHNGHKKNGIEIPTAEVEMDDIEKNLLDLLSSAKTPVSENTLLETLGITRSQLMDAISSLDAKGYDIKRILHGRESYWSLVRFSSPDERKFYRILGKLEYPLLITSDWHIGSRGFSQEVFMKLIEDVKEYGVKDVIVAGDILQGRGVHKVEALDVKIWQIDKQEELASELISQIEARVHGVIGNHEEKIKGSVMVGHDPVKAIALMTDNFYYYGHVANLELPNNRTLLMYHGKGGVSYAWSYRPQRFFDSLKQKPDLLVVGHYHIMFDGIHATGARLILPGTLQRENSYLLSRGLTPVVGWYIILDWDEESLHMVQRTPKYM